MKLLIRKAKPGDEIKVAEMINEGIKRDFWKYTCTDALIDKAKLKKMRANYQDKKDVYLLAIYPLNKKVVGSIFLHLKSKGRTKHRGEMGWGIHPNYSGIGVASKLMKKIIGEAKKRKLIRLEAEVAVKNIASIKLAKKYGFKIEGRKKAGLLLDDGKYVDTFILGRIL